MFLTSDEQTDLTPFRGFYNEFLRKDLHDIRKAFDYLSSSMQVQPIPEGLHGYGFSSTLRNITVYVKADNKIFKLTN